MIRNYYFCIYWVLTITLFGVVGCGSTYTQPFDQYAKKAASQTSALVQEKGAAIVVRVSYKGEYCPRAQALLHPIVNGAIDRQSLTYVGQGTQARGLSITKPFFQMMTFDIAALKANGTLNQDIRTSFAAIKPGDYVITRVDCSVRDRNITLGFDPVASFLGKNDKMLPVAGTSFIHIGSGDIVDAGILEIITDEIGIFPFSKSRAHIVGQEAPSVWKENFRSSLPDLYGKMIFTKFSNYYGRL